MTAVPALHDGRRTPVGQAGEDALGYVIAGGGRRVYFAGDTELFEEMSGLRPLDLALLPVWGWGPSLNPGHLDPAGARALALLRPRVAVPIRLGTFYRSVSAGCATIASPGRRSSSSGSRPSWRRSRCTSCSPAR